MICEVVDVSGAMDMDDGRDMKMMGDDCDVTMIRENCYELRCERYLEAGSI